MKALTIALLGLALTGCTMTDPWLMEDYKETRQRMGFPAQEYAALNVTGNATLIGIISYKEGSISPRLGSGSEVILAPRTSYTDEHYRFIYDKRVKLTAWADEAWAYHQRTVADSEGKFMFRDVAPGGYYIITSAGWDAMHGNIWREHVMVAVDINAGVNTIKVERID